jgi:hypothetical protein
MLKFLLLLAVSSYLTACSTSAPLYPRHELYDQILKPRPQWAGYLTNSRQVQPLGAKLGETVPELVTYDLKDATLRADLNRLSFVCKIAGRQFKICLERPGYCRKKEHFWQDDELEYIDAITQHNYLLQAKTRCFSWKRHDWLSQ